MPEWLQIKCNVCTTQWTTDLFRGVYFVSSGEGQTTDRVAIVCHCCRVGINIAYHLKTFYVSFLLSQSFF